MKNCAIFLLMALTLPVFGQKDITMCHSSATEKFAVLASTNSFKEAHLDPEDYTHVPKVGKNITFKASDGSDAYGYFIKSRGPSNKFLFVFHEWYGLNDYIRKESEKLFNDLENVNVLAIDLYDQKIAANSEEASRLVREVKTERAHAIIKGAAKFAGEKAEIATLGWCFGGGWSLQAAILLHERTQACVIYYGMPELDIEKLKRLDSDVLGIFAAKDQMITPQIVQEFAEKMEEAENDFEYKIFDAVHAFANPSNPHHDSEATKEAYDMTIRFLKEEF